MSDTGIMRQDEYFEVLDAVKNHIITAQKTVMNAANEERNRLYWRIGKTITEHSTWGNKFVQTLSKDLRMEYPSAGSVTVTVMWYALPSKSVSTPVAEATIGILTSIVRAALG